MAFREHRYSAERGWTRYSFVKHLKRWDGLPSHLTLPDPGEGAYAKDIMAQLQCGQRAFAKARELAGVARRKRIPGKTYLEPYTRDEMKAIMRAFYLALSRGIINSSKRTGIPKPLRARSEDEA